MVESTDELVHKISKQSLKGANPSLAEEITSTSPPGLPQENPKAVVVSNLKLAEACLLVVHPQGGSV